MVANIQQIHTNGDGTLCITPMQVQKSGHQCTTSINSNTISNSNSSSISSAIGNISPNTNAMSFNNSQFSTPTALANGGIMSHHHQNNLLDLCRVLQQNTHHYSNNNHSNNNHNIANGVQFNHIQSCHHSKNKSKKHIGATQIDCTNNNSLLNTNFFTNNNNNNNSNNNYNQIQSHININSDTISINNNNTINNSNEEKYSNFTPQQSQHAQAPNESQTIAGGDANSVVVHMSSDSHSIKMECDVEIA